MKNRLYKITHSPFSNFCSSAFGLILLIFIFLLVPLALFVFVTSRTAVIGGLRSYIVQSGSMKPTIDIGSMVFVYPQKSYLKGDVVTFRRGSITVTHRINDIQGTKYLTKGDANSKADSQVVDKKDIIGKDVIVVPFVGKLSAFVKTPFGFILIFAIPTLLFVFYEFLQIKREWEKIIEKKIRVKLEQTYKTAL